MEWLNAIVAAIVGLVGAFGGGSIIYWRQNRKSKEAEASKSETDAQLAKVDLTEKIMEKFQRIVLDRMDSGDAVRSKEFQELEAKIDHRFDIIEEEDKRQNDVLQQQANTLHDVVEYLNGGFQSFEAKKNKKGKKQ